MKGFYFAAGLLALAACSDATSPNAARTESLKVRSTLAAGDNVIKVREADIARQAENTYPGGPWVFYTRAGTATGAFVEGPATVPLGTGSFQMSTPAGTDKGYLFNYDHVGTKLSDITAISYSTYRTSGNLSQVAALNIQIDYNGPDVTGGFSTLIFEPVYNLTQGAVANDTWQAWDAFAGGSAVWWSSRPIPGVCAFDCFVTWNAILAANPDATIFGGFGVNQGSGNGSLTTAVDALKIGYGGNSVTYDFDDSVCHFTDDTGSKTLTLEGDCVTTETINLNDGYTLDGNHFTITAANPSGGTFMGPIVQAIGTLPGSTANVHDLTVTGPNIASACGSLTGIYFFNVAGSILNNTVTNVNRGPNGCQDGSGIDARNATDAGSYVSVTISGNTVNAYNKNGITANGRVSVVVTNNTVTGLGPVGLGFAAQNGIQISRGATGIVKGNTVSGNNYTPKSYVACGLLLYQASGVKVSSNNLFSNEINQCNAGKGGGTVLASN